ncbi:excinuclease ABC subunit A [Thermosulfidibacter takaii ABI70S6]|uniref:UvrABC system protein A n=1 Tax=Thermosulfidibacter takaii (strain DSM 17441 / JCM 13301 / NBRC 103674 / ABI70S6) TaxID=1298851 RepID=A0A0S3QRQ9_THET7|nr:excinuclease ABC subunit UvrA [Thermosulfidibacter takaii]BAT70961.1 excinuclease ABC subunit A [Thermosulfidibacter takaii ABI70S6]
MSLDKESIVIRGARVHNLKNIDLEIPKNSIVVITGVSGSGKSSLAFDTIYAEGYRRYVESLSSYARQFLEVMEKPDVDAIYGLTPSIAIDQKAISKNPRSTVGTVTEIYDYLRVLFARVGDVVCPKCNIPVKGYTVQEIVDVILALPENTKAMILAPLVVERKGEYQNLFQRLKRDGFVRVRVDGDVRRLDDEIKLDKNKKHTIEVVVDRIKIAPKERVRITDSVELALKLSDGLVIVWTLEKEYLFSEKFSCPRCGFSIGELSPRLFSFNSPLGACPVCKGLGFREEVDPNLAVVESLSIEDGAVIPFRESDYWSQVLVRICEVYDMPTNVPFCKLSEEHKNIILNGAPDPVLVNFKVGKKVYRKTVYYWGLRDYLEHKLSENPEEISEFIVKKSCSFCRGSRLKPEALAVVVGGKNIHEVVQMTVSEGKKFFERLNLTGTKAVIAERILREITQRLDFLEQVGLGYITLDREAYTLSGGESQRIRLATQIGSALSGVTYVLDEPTIGLHPRDTHRLVENLKRLRDLGNTVIVVEHDPDVINSADFIVDLGPGAGIYGGEVVYAGSVEGIKVNDKSLTGRYLSGELRVYEPDVRRSPRGFLEFKGVKHRNLKNLNIKIPVGCFVCITGVSGSGKSSLLMEVVYPAVYNRIYKRKMPEGAYEAVLGWEQFDKVIKVDQSPIGRTPRSNPATYVGFFTPIRELFASVPEAKARGYKPGRFSFNVKGGRCEHCRGEGYIKVEMLFLPDLYVKCDACEGKRYNRETLEILYKGKSIADVLEMSVDEAYEFFQNIPSVANKLKLLLDVGLGYIKLGQPATTLSGGEAQRIKLAKELSKRATGRTLYILDEPTVGLHMDDVDKLVRVLHRLVDKGNTVIVIEHNLDVIKNADYVIDLGPEGGDEGGYVVAQGTPEEVASNPSSFTGRFLSSLFCGKRN